MFKIISESAVAAGVRCIEAITGQRVEELMYTIQDSMIELRTMFNNAPDVKNAVTKAIEENAELKKQLDEFRKEKAMQIKHTLIADAKEINGVTLIKSLLPLPSESVKDIAFQLRTECGGNTLIVLGNEAEGKPMLTVAISDSLVKENGLNAGQLVREAAKLMQGGGGGQPHFATAGGKNLDGLNAAVDKVVELANL